MGDEVRKTERSPDVSERRRVEGSPSTRPRSPGNTNAAAPVNAVLMADFIFDGFGDTVEQDADGDQES